MRMIKKTLCVLLAAVLLLSLFCACSGEKREQQRVIGTCAGYEVLYEELRYVTLTYKDLFEATYGEGIWENPETAAQYRAELEATVWGVMRNNYAVLALCADFMPEDSIKSQTIEDAVEEKMNEALEAYGDKKELKKALDEMYMTENFMRFCLRVAQLENELYYVVTQDLGLIENDMDAFTDWLEDGNCVYVQHVYIRNDAGESVEANRALAEQTRNSLRNGSLSISQAVGSSLNEDLQNVAPYYVVRDVFAEHMETAAFALQNEGDVSDVVETPDGFYVLVRMQDSEATLVSKVPSLLKSYQWAKLEGMVDEKKATLSVELNEYGKSIDLLAIR